MSSNISVMIAGRNKSHLDCLESSLQSQVGLDISVNLISNGHVDPLHGVQNKPDLLLFDLDGDWKTSLESLSSRRANDKPALITVTSDNDPQTLRLAMQSGSRDFFIHPVKANELVESIRKILQEKSNASGNGGTATAIINSRGGSGGSTIVANVGYILQRVFQQQTALVDLDIQFGVLPFYLDLTATNGLLSAIENVKDLDGVALRGYMLKHDSGLHLLASSEEQISSLDNISLQNLGSVLDEIVSNYEQVIIDLPRRIDDMTKLVLEHADNVILVTQQTLVHLHDTKRLLGMLKDTLAVPMDRVHVIVNRYDAKSSITAEHIRETLHLKDVILIPDDYKHVVNSVNLGVPLYQDQRKSPVTKSLISIAQTLFGGTEVKKGLFSRLFGG